MRRVVFFAILPFAVALAPFGLLWIWRALERGYTGAFYALSIGDQYTLQNGPDMLAWGSILIALLFGVPAGWEISDALRVRAVRQEMEKQREAELEWRIERRLECAYSDAMRDFVRERKIEPLTANRAPVVVEQ